MESDSYLVEAIEEGKIVRVTEEYARREGLVILKKPEMTKLQEKVSHLSPSTLRRAEKEDKKSFLSNYPPKKPDWKEKQVISELVDNFQWTIRGERRKKGLTRKQFARVLNEPEESLQMIEAGRLPASDFVLINKIQKSLGINLRKDKKDFDISMKEMMSNAKDEEYKELKREGIEILDDDI